MPPRRLLRLTLLSAVVGLAGGGAAYCLVHLIGLLTNLLLFQRSGWTIPSLRDFHPGPWLYLVTVGGAMIVAIFAKWAPVIKGHGLPEAMEAVLTKQSKVSPRTAIAKPLSSAVAIGSGGPFGAEGPIIVTGGAIGSLLGQLVHVSPNERKILLASGAAAGMAATFGSPLAAVILAIELLLFEFSTRAFIPLVVAAAVAGGVHSALFGSGPLFTPPHHDFTGLGQLPLFVLLGGLCGILAVIITKGLFITEHLYRKLPVSEFWHPAIGAIVFATVGLVVPRALGVGYDAIDDVLAGRLALGTLGALALAKLIAWWFALGSGTSGGTLAPILLISAAVGGTLGELASRMLPGAHLSPGAFALVAMAATFGAATRAPFASIVFVFELTRDYNAILPLMIATVIATLLATALMQDSIMTEKLTRRGLHVPSDYHVDLLATVRVDQVMTRDVVVLDSTLSVEEGVRRFHGGHHGAYPVVDADGRCVGILGRGDLLHGDLADDQTLGDVAAREIVAIKPGDTVAVALQTMVEEGVDHLPVLDADGALVGICTRGDILAARRSHLSVDRVQHGWRPGRLSA